VIHCLSANNSRQSSIEKESQVEEKSITNIDCFCFLQLLPKNSVTPSQSEQSSVNNKIVILNKTFTDFRCDGRQYCSQMKSYEEAKYFIENCPNTKMDGDNDGIPCERQFGRH